MELVEHVIGPAVMHSGAEVTPLVAGERYREQKFVDGEIADVLAEVTCPAGKKWSVRSIVEITETDA